MTEINALPPIDSKRSTRVAAVSLAVMSIALLTMLDGHAASMRAAVPSVNGAMVVNQPAITAIPREPYAARPLPEKTARGSSHWAYQPLPATIAPPSVASTSTDGATSWPRNEIDLFVLARLQRDGLQPAPTADRRTLLRRAYLDLVGVPPTVEQVNSFLEDHTEGAYARRIDLLLDSPMYGQRWGRHWLDVARYADSNGVDENIAYANAFHYRDYVIGAFNRDLPFNEFLVEQIAGDLLGEVANPTAEDDVRTRDRIAALGFLALGPKMLAEPDKEKERVDVIDEQIDVVTKAFLGQTIACARCHDHKFDPISHADYFAISGVFRSVSTFDDIATVGHVAQRPLATLAEISRLESWRAHAKKLDQTRDDARKELRLAEKPRALTRLTNALADSQARFGHNIVVTASHEVKQPLAQRDALALAFATREQHESTRPPEPARALVVKESKVDETAIHDRGDHMSPVGEVIARAVPAMFERALAGPTFPADASGRLELARWMANADNPLTARVAVNRLWTWHFGTGIVDTPSNFGILGSKPSHPELLDFLARQFTLDGWSMKAMHRFIMNSATYQQSSSTLVALPTTDPDNRLLSRFPRRRVEAEIIRDSVLSTSGALDVSIGGTLLSSGDHEYVTNDQSGNSARYDSLRRAVYLPVIRNAMFGLFTAFDYPDASAPVDCRPRTVVAPQALFFMNAPFVEEAAKRLVQTMVARSADSDAHVRDAFRLTLARDPDLREHDDSRAFLADLARDGLSDQDALVRLCHALLSTNEFVTME